MKTMTKEALIALNLATASAMTRLSRNPDYLMLEQRIKDKAEEFKESALEAGSPEDREEARLMYRGIQTVLKLRGEIEAGSLLNLRGLGYTPESNDGNPEAESPPSGTTP